jgi:hypothetical protein
MSFRCPQCLTIDSLDILAVLELPPDRHNAEIALQVVGCSSCSFCGLAVFCEARDDVPEVESWTHTGFWVSMDAVASVLGAIRACPDPHNPYCQCLSHTSLGMRDFNQRWRGLLELNRGHTFSMRMARRGV